MTELRSTYEERVHQQKSMLRDSFRLNCKSPPEIMTYIPAQKAATMLNNSLHRGGVTCKPVLQSVFANAHLDSTSGGSTTSSTSTTTTAATVGWQCSEAQAAISESQFDECEIFFLSPSKRKSSLRACERLNSFSPTVAAKATTHLAGMSSSAFVDRAAGGTLDRSFNSYDVPSSHYSDTAMQLLRSGSYSGLVGNKLVGMDVNFANSLKGSLLALQHATPAQRTHNSVTFSRHISEQRPALHHGSLGRHKARSSQLLCSCDAGADTEINLDPTRPLYQYSLERRHKTHTYTCEQNAQILMRLQRERERNRKLSLSGNTSIYGLLSDKTGLESNTTSLSDLEANSIPPVPPPPSVTRNVSFRNSTLQARSLASSVFNSSLRDGRMMGKNNNNNINVLTPCDRDMNSELNGAGGNSGHCSAIDDCATSVVKCASFVSMELAGDRIVGGTSNGAYKPQSAKMTALASSAKPDVCHVGAEDASAFRNYPMPFVCDDIFMPNSQTPDPSLCFLHAGPQGVGPGPGPGTDHTRPEHEKQRARGALISGFKYNTIGPSSKCARQLAKYAQQERQQQQQLQSITDRCRCFSHSLTDFPREYFGQLARQQDASTVDAHIKARDQHVQHSFTRNGDVDDDDWLYGVPSLPHAISRSYGNLVDLPGGGSSRVPYQKLKTSANVLSSKCNFGAATGLLKSNATLDGSFKEELHQLHHHEQQLQLQQTQLTTPPHLRQHSSRPQQSRQHQQAAAHHQQQKLHHLHSSVASIMPWKHRQCPSRGSSSSGTNSFRFDATKHWLAVSSILLIIGAASVAVPLALRVAASAPFEERLRVAVQLLDQVPLIDGHNDLPWNIRKFLHNKLNDFNFNEDLRSVMPWGRSHWSHTDLQRLKKGRISAQFWAAYVPCEAQHRDAVQLTLEQIDVIKRLTDRYSPQLTTCTSSEDIIEAHKNHQLCSLTGVEGGHSLGGSLAVLRTLYTIGVRYMTLTSTCHTPWADSSYADAPTFNVKHGGLTIFGKTIIREMNRLGMMVDLSHVSTSTMRDALEVSEAPVIFSHSSAYELCNSSRNVQDDMLHSLTKNGGLVMVNFYSKFLSCSNNSTVHDAVAHINHIRRVAGIDHVGLGAGYDGINFTPKGLEDVSSYPTLFAELLGVGWSIDDLTKLAGGNFLRVMQQVEKLRDEKKAVGLRPYEDHPNFRTDDPYNCTSS